MHAFRVWAPLPGRVEIQIGKKRFPMAAAANGWWEAEVFSSRHEDEYGFVLDGEGPFS